MRLEKQYFKILEQEPGLIGLYKHCELAGRICYRSEDKIDDESYKKMLNIFYQNKHYSPLAHGTVYLRLSNFDYDNFIDHLSNLSINGIDGYTWFNNPMWTRTNNDEYFVYITTNYRVIVEMGLEGYLNSFMTPPTEFHTKRYSVLIRTNIGVTRELNRHASGLAINEESTRYCNYTRDKFGNEITFIDTPDINDVIIESYKEVENKYNTLIKNGYKPQQARRILPLGTATTVLYTGFSDEWKHVFELRTSNAAHPDVVEIMTQIQHEFKNRKYID